MEMTELRFIISHYFTAIIPKQYIHVQTRSIYSEVEGE